jgi:hypothetical protein
LNSTVKTGGVMNVQLPKDIVKLCTAVIRPLKKERDTFFSDNRNVYNKHTSKIMKTLGLSGGASCNALIGVITGDHMLPVSFSGLPTIH